MMIIYDNVYVSKWSSTENIDITIVAVIDSYMLYYVDSSRVPVNMSWLHIGPHEGSRSNDL